MTTTVASAYPVQVTAQLDPPLSRWLWLVKWVTAIPHLLVLTLLWIAFVVLSVGAFFAILATGRYPRAVFDFNVGVLRWTWRVQYYTYGALATDRYPPFTLADVPDYPAHLDIAYPAHLSRGLALVKWWLLAIPHYLVVGLFLGGTAVFGWHVAGGLVGLLAVVGAVVLLFTGRYPQPIYDFVLGMNRWALRVAAYAALMTDEYPPFRLDMGGEESGSTTVLPGPAAPSGPDREPPVDGPPASQPRLASPRRPWTAGRVTAVVTGSVLLLVSVGLFAGGGVALWADQHRDGGYVTSGQQSYSTGGYAITTERISLGDPGWSSAWQSDVFGTVRIRATSVTGAAPLFLGVGPSQAVDRYLAGVGRTRLDGFGHHAGMMWIPGPGPSASPLAQGFWSARAAGAGEQTLVWSARGGDWTVVAMNADASPGLQVRADAGATMPALPWIATGLLAGGGVLLLGGGALVIVPVRRAGLARAPGQHRAADGRSDGEV